MVGNLYVRHVYSGEEELFKNNLTREQAERIVLSHSERYTRIWQEEDGAYVYDYGSHVKYFVFRGE